MIEVTLSETLPIQITVQSVTGELIADLSKPSTIDAQIISIARGEKGEKGDSGEGFNYTQSSPSAIWVIAHNLGLKPSVNVFSVGGVAMYGTVQHISDNVLNINFNTAVAGFARLN